MNSHQYDDIINLPHHISKNRPQMSLRDRAAQFAPFAALTGYDEAVRETARLTDRKEELSDEDIALLNQQIQLLIENIKSHPQVKITYFVPDERKDGGRYETITATVRRIDTFEKLIVFDDKTKLSIDQISNIQIL